MRLPKIFAKKEQNVKKDKKGYILTIDKYIKLLKENDLKIDKVEITLNEVNEIDVKIIGKEG